MRDKILDLGKQFASTGSEVKPGQVWETDNGNFVIAVIRPWEVWSKHSMPGNAWECLVLRNARHKTVGHLYTIGDASIYSNYVRIA